MTNMRRRICGVGSPRPHRNGLPGGHALEPADRNHRFGPAELAQGTLDREMATTRKVRLHAGIAETLEQLYGVRLTVDSKT